MQYLFKFKAELFSCLACSLHTSQPRLLNPFQPKFPDPGLKREFPADNRTYITNVQPYSHLSHMHGCHLRYMFVSTKGLNPTFQALCILVCVIICKLERNGQSGKAVQNLPVTQWYKITNFKPVLSLKAPFLFEFSLEVAWGRANDISLLMSFVLFPSSRPLMWMIIKPRESTKRIQWNPAIWLHYNSPKNILYNTAHVIFQHQVGIIEINSAILCYHGLFILHCTAK